MMKKKNGFGFRFFFVCLLLLMLAFNFTGRWVGVSHLHWHFFLHIGIVVFSFLILIYSLKLNEMAMRYIIFGSVIWIIVNCVLFLSHVFVEYAWIEANLFTFFGMVIGGLVMMKGFREAIKNG